MSFSTWIYQHFHHTLSIIVFRWRLTIVAYNCINVNRTFQVNTYENIAGTRGSNYFGCFRISSGTYSRKSVPNVCDENPKRSRKRETLESVKIHPECRLFGQTSVRALRKNKPKNVFFVKITDSSAVSQQLPRRISNADVPINYYNPNNLFGRFSHIFCGFFTVSNSRRFRHFPPSPLLSPPRQISHGRRALYCSVFSLLFGWNRFFKADFFHFLYSLCRYRCCSILLQV